jgi:hypothetical protein
MRVPHFFNLDACARLTQLMALMVPTVVAALPGHAQASTVVYTQAPTQTIGDVSAVANIPSDPGFTWTLDQDSEAWAYFSAPANASINRIEWYGSDSDGNFAVDLFAASCFSCSASWVGTGGQFTTNLLPNNGAYTQAQVHKTLMSGGLYDYYIDLPSALTLGSSPAYALSVVNNYTALPFVWAGSAAGSGVHLRYIVGQAMFLKAPGNLAFTLSNTSVSAVPEPDSAALMLTSLALLGLFAGRYRRAA